MSSRIFKTDGEMPEIMESKVSNPKNSSSRNWRQFKSILKSYFL